MANFYADEQLRKAAYDRSISVNAIAVYWLDLICDITRSKIDIDRLIRSDVDCSIA